MTFLYKIGGFLLTVLIAVLSVFKLGQSKEREKQAVTAATQAKRANEIDDEARGRGAAAARKRLRQRSKK